MAKKGSAEDREKNDDIRLELHLMDTLLQKIERRRLQWFGHVKRMNNSRDYQQKHWKHWYRVQDVAGDKARGGLTTTKRKWYNTTRAECAKDRKQREKFIHAVPLSATYELRRTSQRRRTRLCAWVICVMRAQNERAFIFRGWSPRPPRSWRFAILKPTHSP